MFKLKFSKTYDNSIFTQYNITPIIEDYYKTEKNIFCVADGITRDLVDGNIARYPKNKEEVIELMKKYPNPSGAYEAANICASNFVRYLSELGKTKLNEDVLLDIVKKANNDIWQINKDRNIDYTIEDIYCCVAAGGIILDDYLYCFCIGDCHIALLNENTSILFTTDNDISKFDLFRSNYLDKLEYDWNNPKDRILIRGFFRNNPKLIGNSKLISYGALTGEKEAEAYIHVYRLKLDNAKYICAYSDGCEPYFDNNNEIKKLIDNPEYIKDKGKERTLVIYERTN